MNYYNPYFYSLPQMAAPKLGGLRGLLSSTKGFSLGGIINGTQKTLNIINQAIPIIKQASPMMRNAKTMLKIANEFKRVDAPTTDNPAGDETPDTKETTNTNAAVSESGPTFFL